MTPDKASSTAQLIAKSTVFMAHNPRLGHLVPPEAANASIWFLKATSPRANQLLWLIDQKWFRTTVAVIEALTIPGILLHYILRKRYLEDLSRDAIKNGIEQVVILGAGFDTLALRLHKEFPTVTFIEVDHPATQRIKLGAMEQHAAIGSNLHFLPVDLSRQTLKDSLLPNSDYKSDSRTLFVAEGLLMYLEPNKVDELFQFAANYSGDDSRFAFTFLEPQPNGKVNFRRGSRLIDFWLTLRHEGFRWGIKCQNLESYITNRGLSLRELAGARALRQRYLKEPSIDRTRLAQGEHIGLAELKSDN